MLAKKTPGWLLLHEYIGANQLIVPKKSYEQFTDLGLGVIVQLHFSSTAEGTIPLPSQYVDYAKTVGAFVKASSGCKYWMIGEDLNLPRSWPVTATTTASPVPASSTTSTAPAAKGREKITPQDYARLFTMVRESIKLQTGHDKDIVVTGAVRPWSGYGSYAGNETGDWVQWFTDMLTALAGKLDGIAIQTGTHSSHSADIFSNELMSAPYVSRLFSFRSYRDFMAAIPVEQQKLPVFITKAFQREWVDQSNGWIPAAYQEINQWNVEHPTRKITAMFLNKWGREEEVRTKQASNNG